MKYLYTFPLLALLCLSPASIVNAVITNAALQIPGNYSGWYVCSTTPTGDISYSLRVINTQPKNQSTLGTMIPPIPVPSGTAQKNLTASVYALTMSDDNVKVYASAGDFQYQDTLSCIKPVTKCDQDVGGDPVTPPSNLCLVVTNPTTGPVNINVTYSFDTTSVFGNKNFTSPEVPGGNSTASNNGTNSTSSNSAASPSQSNAGNAKSLSGYMSAGAAIVWFLAFSGFGF